MPTAKYTGTLLTPEVHVAIVKSVENGAYLVQAFREAGINPETGYAWLERKAKKDAAGGIYARLRDDVERALAKYENEVVGIVRKAAVEDWRAGIELLKRRFPERWGDTQRVEMAMAKIARDELAREVLKHVEDAVTDANNAKHFTAGGRDAILQDILERVAHGSGQPEALSSTS